MPIFFWCGFIGSAALFAFIFLGYFHLVFLCGYCLSTDAACRFCGAVDSICAAMTTTVFLFFAVTAAGPATILRFCSCWGGCLGVLGVR